MSGSECVGGVGSVGALVCGWHGSNFGVGGVGLINFGVGQKQWRRRRGSKFLRVSTKFWRGSSKAWLA